MPALSADHACSGSSRSALTVPHFRQRIRYPRRVWTTYAELGVWLQPPSAVGLILVPPRPGRYSPSQLLSSRRGLSFPTPGNNPPPSPAARGLFLNKLGGGT